MSSQNIGLLEGNHYTGYTNKGEIKPIWRCRPLTYKTSIVVIV